MFFPQHSFSCSTIAGFWSKISPVVAGNNISVPGSGTNSEFFGALAGSNGDYNVAMGYQAMGAGTSGGTESVAIGWGALYNNQASGNCAIGFQAMYNTTTGAGNFAGGTLALVNNVSGQLNMAFGTFAGLENTTGSNNTSIGTKAGYATTTSSDNTMIGYQAGYTATALYANVTGAQNVFVGSESGPNSPNQNTNSIAIGYQATVGISNTGVLGSTGASAIRLGVCSGQSSIYSQVGGELSCHFTSAGNTSTAETDLYNDLIPKNTLSMNGDQLLAKYAGTFISSATATRRLKVYFAGILIIDTGALATTSSAVWQIDLLLIRSSSSGARATVTVTVDGVAVSQPGAVVDESTLTGISYASVNTLKITGTSASTGAATNDIVAKIGSIAWKPSQFNPSCVSGLTGWFKADSGTYQDTALATPAVADADPVGHWLDLSGNGNHLVQSTGSSKPALKLNIQNGMPVIRFNGSTSFMTAALASTQPYTIVFAAKIAQNSAMYIMDGSSANTGFVYNNGGNDIYMYAGVLGNDYSVTQGAPRAFALVFNGSSSKIFVDSSVAALVGDAGSGNTGGLTLGTSGGGSGGFQGDIYELLFFNSDVSAQLPYLMDYLKRRWLTP